MKANDLFISVLVCTYNQSAMLKGCLESLIQQTLHPSKYEIIVIDNNSTDDTYMVVQEFCSRFNIMYVLEKQQGLSYARNRGYQEAFGDYVAYIDDDARAAANWLEVAYQIILNSNASLDCLGGPYHPFYTTPKPNWFKDAYEVRGFGNKSKFLSHNEFLSGSNMIWHKQRLYDIQGFPLNKGVIGNRLRLGEETKALIDLRMIKENAQVFYSPDLIIYHWVPPHKMLISYRYRRKFAEGQFVGEESRLAGKRNRFLQISKSTYLLFRATIRFLLRFNFKWQNWLVEDGAKVAYFIGRLSSQVGIN